MNDSVTMKKTMRVPKMMRKVTTTQRTRTTLRTKKMKKGMRKRDLLLRLPPENLFLSICCQTLKMRTNSHPRLYQKP